MRHELFHSAKSYERNREALRTHFPRLSCGLGVKGGSAKIWCDAFSPFNSRPLERFHSNLLERDSPNGPAPGTAPVLATWKA
jgi:hypothetical protein